MSFWSTRRLLSRQEESNLIRPFDKQFAKQGAYERSLGPDVFITSEADQTKQTLENGKQVSIPPGQFGLLITEEVVTIPQDAIGFISVRFTIKRRGLVNVSGFHVDPGFSGRLQFAVYNAGSQSIVLARGDRVFMIWFSDLTDRTPDPYNGKNFGQMQISSDDVMYIKGEVASPAVLKKKIEGLEREVAFIKSTLVALTIAFLVALFKSCSDSKPAQPIVITPAAATSPSTDTGSPQLPSNKNMNSDAPDAKSQQSNQ
jgi:dCTP deaminase